MPICSVNLWYVGRVETIKKGRNMKYVLIVDDSDIKTQYHGTDKDIKYAGLHNGKIVEFSNDKLSLNHDHIDQIIEIELNGENK